MEKLKSDGRSYFQNLNLRLWSQAIPQPGAWGRRIGSLPEAKSQEPNLKEAVFHTRRNHPG
jgi:hypothetical protein